MSRHATTVSALSLCVALAAGVSSAQSQDTPAATFAAIGAGTTRLRRLVPYDNAFVVTQLFKDGHVAYPGIWTDQLRWRDVGGRKLFVRTQGLAYYDGRFLSSVNAFDAATFAPVSSIQHNPDGSTEKWTFDGSRATGQLAAARGAPVNAKTVDFGTPFVDLNCCMRSILPAMLPLRAAYSITVPAFEGTDELSQVAFKVIGRETVRAGARGKVDAWVVETPVPGGYIRFWINESPPYLVRMTLSTNDKSAYAQSFDMLAPGAVAVAPPVESALDHGDHKSR